MAPGWSQTESPFMGELAIPIGCSVPNGQASTRVVRLSAQQHQQFYSQLPYLIVARWMHRVILGLPFWWEPGFVSSPNDRTYTSPVNL